MVSPASNKAQLKFSYKVLTHTTVIYISFYQVSIFLTRKINSSTKIILKDDEIELRVVDTIKQGYFIFKLSKP